MADDTVRMVHPKLKATADAPVTVPRRAFDEVWSDLGWELHVPDDEPAVEWTEVTVPIDTTTEDDPADTSTDPVTPSDTTPHTPRKGKES